MCFGWSVHLVASTAQQLRATPFERLASHLDPAEMDEWDDDDLGYLREYYQTLVTFFDAAASSGSAATMTVSYCVEAGQYVLRLYRVSSVDDVRLNAAGAGAAALAKLSGHDRRRGSSRLIPAMARPVPAAMRKTSW